MIARTLGCTDRFAAGEYTEKNLRIRNCDRSIAHIVGRRWMEGMVVRLIDADALGIGRCSRKVLPSVYCAGWNGVINLIDKAPTVDAVAVVRCKGCQKWKRNVGLTDSPNGHCFEHDIDTNGRDFCSYGERMRQAKRG